MRLFAVVGGVLVALLVAALVVPPLIDWTSYRADFERAASRVLGQPVHVGGAASARLLPLPRIAFGDVTIGDADSPLLTADRFTLDMELAPLLRGDVRIVSVDLDRPRGRVRVREDGSVDWLARRPGTIAVPADSISIEAVRVTDGALTLEDERRDASIAVAGLDAELSARSLAGPWRGTGTFTYDGERYHVAGSTGSVRADGETVRMSTRVTLKPAARPYDLSIAGPLIVSPRGASLSGTFRFDPVTQASLDATPDFLRSRADEALPVSAQGDILVSAQRLAVPQLELRVGTGDDPYRLSGTAEAFFEGDRRYQLTLEGAQFDVDRIAAAERDARAAEGSTIEERLAALRSVLSQIPQPDLPGEVQLDLPALVAGDTVVREVSLTARPLPQDDGWRIERLSARLPGRTLVEASGRLGVPLPMDAEDVAPAPFTFEGDVLLASRQPSGFARWLARDVDDAIRQLPRAGFQAKVAVNAERARFDDLELQLGNDRLTGRLARIAGTAAGRPRLLANLEGNRVDVDTASALFGLFAGATGPSLIAHDLDLRLGVREAVLDGVPARGVDVSLIYDDGNLVVDRLSIAEVVGGAVEAQGRVDSLYDRPRGGLDGRVRVERGAPFMAFLADRVPLPPALRHLRLRPSLIDGTDLSFEFDAASSGGGSKLQLSLDGVLGGTQLVATTRFDGKVAAPEHGRLDVSFKATNDEPRRLFDQLGLAAGPTPIDGAAALTVQLDGRPTDGLALDATFSLDKATFSTRGSLRYRDGVGDTYGGDFTLAGTEVDPFLAATGIAFPGIGLGTPADLTGTVEADATQLVLKAKGMAADTALDASVSLDLEARPRPVVRGALALDRLDLVSLASLVWGAGVDPAVWLTDAKPPPFGASILAGVDGTVRLSAAKADLGLGLLPAAPASTFETVLRLTDGDLQLKDIRADWLDGRLAGTLSLARVGGEGIFSADLELNDASVAATGLTGEDPLLSGRLGLDVAVEAQGRDLAALLARMTGGGVLRLDAVLSRLDPGAFPTILAAADATADERLEREGPSLVREALLAGTTPLDVDVPITIAGGVARASGVALDLPGLDAVLDLRADLVAATLDGTLRAGFEVTDDAQTPTGVSPDVRLEIGGSFSRPQVRLDATALTTFLTTRLRERREREFEAQRAAVLERQRLAREMRLMRASERAYRERRRRQRRDEPEDARLRNLPGSPG